MQRGNWLRFANDKLACEQINELWHLAKALATVELRLIYGDKANIKIRKIY